MFIAFLICFLLLCVSVGFNVFIYFTLKRFDAVREADIKLLDATIENLKKNEAVWRSEFEGMRDIATLKHTGKTKLQVEQHRAALEEPEPEERILTPEEEYEVLRRELGTEDEEEQGYNPLAGEGPIAQRRRKIQRMSEIEAGRNRKKYLEVPGERISKTDYIYSDLGNEEPEAI